MKIILLTDVAKLGKRHDIKDVSSGHALNMLIPQGLAIPATADAVKRTEILKTKSEGEKKLHEDLLLKNLKDLDGVTLTIAGKANAKGHLFAGLHREAIATELLKQTQLQVDPTFILLEHPIKEVGEHIVEVKGPPLPAGGGKSVKFKVVVEREA